MDGYPYHVSFAGGGFGPRGSGGGGGPARARRLPHPHQRAELRRRPHRRRRRHLQVGKQIDRVAIICLIHDMLTETTMASKVKQGI